MGFATTSTTEPQPSSNGTEELLEDIRAHAPGLLRIELQFRAQGRGGRFRRFPHEYLCESEHDRNYRVAYGAIIGVCEKLEEEHGACKFKSTCVVGEVGKTEQTAPPVKFSLDDEEDGTDQEVKGVITMLTRTLKQQDQLLVRQYGYMENLVAMVATSAEAHAKYAGAAAETQKVEYEHQRDMQAATHEADRADAELDLIKDLAPKAMAVFAARDAREATTKKNGGRKKALWRHAIEVAKEIRHRPQVAEIMGERGHEILDALGDAKKKTEVEGLLAELRELGNRGEVNLWALLSVAPEVGVFMDLLHN